MRKTLIKNEEGKTDNSEKGRRKMNLLWGVLLILAGLFMLISGILKSNFIVYRLLVARSRILWGDNVHRFYQISGLAVIVFGFLVIIGLI